MSAFRHPSVLVFIATLALALAGCGQAGDGRLARAWRGLLTGRPVAWRTLAMPRHVRPDEFDLSCRTYSDSIDLRTGTFTWLLGRSFRPNQARFTLTPEQRDSIWSWVLAADAFDLPERVVIPSTAVPLIGRWDLGLRYRHARRRCHAESGFAAGDPVVPGGRALAVQLLVERVDALVRQERQVQALPKPDSIRAF